MHALSTRARTLAVVGIALMLAACGAAPKRTGSPGAASKLFQGSGYEFTYPSGWGPVTRAGAASGASGMSVSAHRDLASIDAHVYPQPSESIDQALEDDLLSIKTELSGGGEHAPKVGVQTVSVAGATQAKELSESYLTAHGRGTYLDLVVITRAGEMIDLEALASASSGYDPASAIASFRLTGG